MEVAAEPPDSPAGHRLEKPLTGPGPDPGFTSVAATSHLLRDVLQAQPSDHQEVLQPLIMMEMKARLVLGVSRPQRLSLHTESCVVVLIFASSKRACTFQGCVSTLQAVTCRLELWLSGRPPELWPSPFDSRQFRLRRPDRSVYFAEAIDSCARFQLVLEKQSTI